VFVALPINGATVANHFLLLRAVQGTQLILRDPGAPWPDSLGLSDGDVTPFLAGCKVYDRKQGLLSCDLTTPGLPIEFGAS
jgi:hypothetical protein